ncbi:hypothetical protein Syun_016383 [Stephania yunnanensis]|uniref:B box-type domain-containing protein n=1 Tax=Stephania yunnanensis TaxID=152371 RepID=A0AAP0P4U8_9MAGN
MESKTLAPPWIESLLSTDFFAVCRVHGDAARSECNMFCLDCNVGAFCFYCRSSKHKDHRVVQIRRSSYHDVVRVAEIENVIDINGVQTYVINSARVMFLNERPLPKVGKAASHICDICGRSLLDSCRFCSLGCKLVGIKRKGDTTFVKDGNSNDNEEKKQREEGKLRRISSIKDHDLDEQEKISEGTKHSSIYTLKSCPSSISISTNTNYTRRSRKGIPRRAPFGT